MTWLIVGAAVFVAWRLLQKKPAYAPVPPGVAVVPQQPGDVPSDAMAAYDAGIERGAARKEYEILQEIQARLNIQRRLDLLSRANEQANGKTQPPKS